MAHMIEDNMMAWKSEQPWHGLGYQVAEDATGEQMLQTAKLDWLVQRRKLAMRDGEGKGLVVDPLNDFRAIVRKDTNEVFQVASDKYFPVQNTEIVNFFREYCEAGHARMETVGGLKGGRIVWALAKLEKGDADLKGDKSKAYMLLANSHDGSIRLIGKATEVYVVCWNTLSAAVGKYLRSESGKGVSHRAAANEGVFLMKHSRKFTQEVANEAKKVMGMAIESIEKTNEIAAQLAQVQIDDQGRLQFVMQLLGIDPKSSATPIVDAMIADSGKSVLDRIIEDEETDEERIGRVGRALLEAMVNSPGSDLPSRKDTLWGAVNGVTYLNDHTRGRSQDQRLYNSWFGTGDTQKNEAVKVALNMAGLN
jgi:phage/plasmid-like protein (TIGR03299 family)